MLRLASVPHSTPLAQKLAPSYGTSGAGALFLMHLIRALILSFRTFLRFIKRIEKVDKQLRMPASPTRILLIFWGVRGIAPTDMGAGGKTVQTSVVLAPQDPRDDWEVPRPWRVFRHSGDHIYWTGHLARNLAFI